MIIKKLLIITAICSIGSAALQAQDQAGRICTTHSLTDEAIKDNPEAIQRMHELEEFTKDYIASENANKGTSNAAVKIIPIVFHIIHTGGSENITYEQIEDAVRIINRDYQKMNADTSEVAAAFQGIIGNPQVEFRLARLDPNGNCTNGVTRTFSDFHKGASDADIKGLISWDSRKYLNVFTVSTIQSGAGAYAYLPGAWPLGSNRDGIVCRVDQLGSIGQSGGSNLAERTLTHEIGHYLNLRHTWGGTNTPGLPSNCSDDDGVEDTPNTVGVDNFTCNKNAMSCGVLNNVENYMDYASCERMFTDGQVVRMQATLNSATAGRNNLWSQSNLIATGTNDGFTIVDCAPIAAFDRAVQVVCTDANVSFKDGSWNTIPVAWEWTFEGGTPATSNLQNPNVKFSGKGSKDIKLKVTNAQGVSDSIVKESYIRVLETVSTVPLPYVQGMEDANAVAEDIYNFSTNVKNWTVTSNAAYAGTSSLVMNFFGSSGIGDNAMLIPAINLKNANAPVLKFKVAYAQRSSASEDKLTVSLSRSCGITYSTLFTKAGSDLATANTQNASFVPNGQGQWREENIPLVNLSAEDNAIFRFMATNEGAGNNIYLDDIEIAVMTGMDQFMYDNLNVQVAPNPFSSTAQINFTLVAEADVEVKVFDLLGKQVGAIANTHLGFGQHSFEINEQNSTISSSGIYFVKVRVNGMEKVSKVLVNR